MVDADEPEFQQMVQVLAMNFSKPVTPKFIELLFSGMRTIPMPAVKAAFRRALETLKFFPTVAELRELAREADEELRAQWDASRALGAVEWDERKPEVGGFRKYLEELAAKKAVKGGANNAKFPGPVAVVREPELPPPDAGDGEPGGDPVRRAGREPDMAAHPARREQVPGGSR